MPGPAKRPTPASRSGTSSSNLGAGGGRRGNASNGAAAAGQGPAGILDILNGASGNAKDKPPCQLLEEALVGALRRATLEREEIEQESVLLEGRMEFAREQLSMVRESLSLELRNKEERYTALKADGKLPVCNVNTSLEKQIALREEQQVALRQQCVDMSILIDQRRRQTAEEASEARVAQLDEWLPAESDAAVSLEPSAPSAPPKAARAKASFPMPSESQEKGRRSLWDGSVKVLHPDSSFAPPDRAPTALDDPSATGIRSPASASRNLMPCQRREAARLGAGEAAARTAAKAAAAARSSNVARAAPEVVSNGVATGLISPSVKHRQSRQDVRPKPLETPGTPTSPSKDTISPTERAESFRSTIKTLRAQQESEAACTLQ